MFFEQKSWRKSDGEMGDEIKLKKKCQDPDDSFKKMKNGFMKMSQSDDWLDD